MAVFLHELRHQPCAVGGDEPQRYDAPLRVEHRSDALLGGVDLAQHPCGVRPDHLAVPVEPQALSHAVEQTGAEVLLQPVDRSRQRGLGDV
ncbi:hypothetical protein ACFQ0O_10230 [Saccharopolyspora spinosporotrichia]